MNVYLVQCFDPLVFVLYPALSLYESEEDAARESLKLKRDGYVAAYIKIKLNGVQERAKPNFFRESVN